jgi:tetratricopeptide (TPR) repeat protein
MADMTTPVAPDGTHGCAAIAPAFEAASIQHRQGNLSEASGLYDRILAIKPDHFGALCGLATVCLQRGKLGDAVALYSKSLGVDPKHAGAHNNIGVAFEALGHFDEAASHFERALAIQPELPQTRANLGNVLRALNRPEEAIGQYQKVLAVRPGDFDVRNNLAGVLLTLGRAEQAIAHYEQVLAARPDSAEAHFNLGNALRALARNEEAMSRYQNALAIRPDYADAHNNLGNALVALGRAEQAIGCYESSIAIKPDAADVHFNLGNVLLSLARHEEAMSRYQNALAIRPGYAEAHNNLGHAFMALNRAEEAIGHYESAIAVRPGFAEAYNYLGGALQKLQRYTEAIACHRQALIIKPDYAEAHCHLGGALHRRDLPEEASAHYRKSLAIRPDYAEAYHGLGIALELLGHLDEAHGAHERAVELAPRRVHFHLALAHSRRFRAGDARLAAIEELARDQASLSEAERIALHFALAKAYADLERHESSFRHLLEGNALKRRQTGYDEAATLRFFERIRTVFTHELMREKRGGGDHSPAPVFVVGMPRSGTTLIEQILASHSEVFGAGELEEFGKAVASLGEANGASAVFPEIAPTLSAEALRRLGGSYLDAIRAAAGPAKRIVDKLPLNFTFVGLIHLALPNARIIYARRDPIDTCLSCFSILFRGDQPHTYDLGDLGRYYRAFEALMQHWQRVLPEGVLLEVRYEDVVDDLEGQARRMVEHCGLEWEAACLAFHQTRRPVRTASVAQVRQPIYRSSVGRWRPYQHLLQPLLQALDAKR